VTPPIIEVDDEPGTPRLAFGLRCGRCLEGIATCYAETDDTARTALDAAWIIEAWRDHECKAPE